MNDRIASQILFKILEQAKLAYKTDFKVKVTLPEISGNVLTEELEILDKEGSWDASPLGAIVELIRVPLEKTWDGTQSLEVHTDYDAAGDVFTTTFNFEKMKIHTHLRYFIFHDQLEKPI